VAAPDRAAAAVLELPRGGWAAIGCAAVRAGGAGSVVEQEAESTQTPNTAAIIIEYERIKSPKLLLTAIYKIVHGRELFFQSGFPRPH
jgi:hypothetical protein